MSSPVPEPETPEGEGDDPTADPLTMMAAGIAGLKGKTRMVPTTSAGFSGDTADRPMRDWKAERIGANPPDVLKSLRSDAGEAVLAACQVPVALFSDADGTSQRESWRRWAMGPLAGLAATVEAELAEKLDVAVRFDFSHLWAQDVAGRASAFKALVAGGMDIATAAGASGVLADA